MTEDERAAPRKFVPYFTAEQVGVILGVSARTAKRYAANGELPNTVQLPSGQFMFEPYDVLAMVVRRVYSLDLEDELDARLVDAINLALDDVGAELAARVRPRDDNRAAG